MRRYLSGQNNSSPQIPHPRARPQLMWGTLHSSAAWSLASGRRSPLNTGGHMRVRNRNWVLGRDREQVCTAGGVHESQTVLRRKNVAFDIYVLVFKRFLELCLGQGEFPSCILGSRVENCLGKGEIWRFN